MANVLNRTTKQYLTSVNTPDFDPALWIINPDLSTVGGFAPVYWNIVGDTVTLVGPAARAAVDDNNFIALINGQVLTNEIFGDGGDGPVTISVDTVLPNDLYPSILVVNAGVTLRVSGFGIFAQYGIINNGTISFDGTDAAAGVAGLGAVTNTRGGGGDGALGATLVGGLSANLLSALAPGYGGGGGDGGAGAAGAGGSGGNTRVGMANARIRPRRVVSVLAGGEFDAGNGFAQYRGGAGGAAGGGDVVNPGGSGGGGAGFLTVAAPYIFNGTTGTIAARGGAGFTPVAGNCGGGGGGGGGVLVAVRFQIRNRGSFLVAGGAPGAGIGTGATGLVGANGRMMSLTVNLAS